MELTSITGVFVHFKYKHTFRSEMDNFEDLRKEAMGKFDNIEIVQTCQMGNGISNRGYCWRIMWNQWIFMMTIFITVL